MCPTTAITLQLTASGVASYCRDLSRRLPHPEKRVAAIDALITFIASQANAGEQAQPEFSAIRQTLLDHFEQAREELLKERAQRLLQALRDRHLPDITAIYASLSRDAFWSLLVRVEQEVDAPALNALRSWASDWLERARKLAQEASPYPDAVDFRGAGLDVAQYSAMTDLDRYLGAGR